MGGVSGPFGVGKRLERATGRGKSLKNCMSLYSYPGGGGVKCAARGCTPGKGSRVPYSLTGAGIGALLARVYMVGTRSLPMCTQWVDNCLYGIRGKGFQHLMFACFSLLF